MADRISDCERQRSFGKSTSFDIGDIGSNRSCHGSTLRRICWSMVDVLVQWGDEIVVDVERQPKARHLPINRYDQGAFIVWEAFVLKERIKC